MKIFGRMLLGCVFAYENIWLNFNLDAFLLLEISGWMLLRCFCLCFLIFKLSFIKKNIKQKLRWYPQYLLLVFVKILQRGATIWKNRTYRNCWLVYFCLTIKSRCRLQSFPNSGKEWGEIPPVPVGENQKLYLGVDFFTRWKVLIFEDLVQKVN